MNGYDPMTSVAALEHVKTRACQCKPYKRYVCPSCATLNAGKRVNLLEALLTEAVERVEKGDLGERMCCDGYMCGCQGSSKADEFLHFARAALNHEGNAE